MVVHRTERTCATFLHTRRAKACRGCLCDRDSGYEARAARALWSGRRGGNRSADESPSRADRACFAHDHLEIAPTLSARAWEFEGIGAGAEKIVFGSADPAAPRGDCFRRRAPGGGP